MTIKDVWRELVVMGYSGSYQPVRRWFYERRQLPAELTGLRISPRHFSGLFIKDEAELTEKEKRIVTALDTMPELKQLRMKAIGFRNALLKRNADGMAAWLEAVTDTPFTSLRNFAAGLKLEWPALKAACSSEYSNGPTEGAVNRLKLVN